MLGLFVVVLTGYGVKLAFFSNAAGTWLSGASSDDVPTGGFDAWRGEPAGVAGTWFDSNQGQIAQWSIAPGGGLANWNKPIDVAIGAIDDSAGESWAAAASGAYDARWSQVAANFKANWTNRGKNESYLMVRFAHELNGDWYPWKVRVGQEGNFKVAWIRFHNILKAQLPQAKLVFNVNKNTSGGMAGPRALFPGKQYVDLYSVDWYNVYPWCNSTSCLDTEFNKRASNGDPWGLETHRQYAAEIGLPLAISEWSNSAFGTAAEGGGGEYPDFMNYINSWMKAHAGTGPGELYYDVLFNLWSRYQLHGPDSQQPQTGARYASLTWGSGGTTATPTPVPTPTSTPTPSAAQISQVGNLLSGKSFTASAPDSVSEPNHPVGNVNDRDETTRWISEPVNDATLATDLGATYALSKVSILWAGDTVKNYELQVSANNINWTTVASGVTNNSSPQLINTISFTASPTGRYFRILTKDRWNSSYGNSIWEIGAYGTLVSAMVGDINSDGVVNVFDLSIFLTKWGQNYAAADLNHDSTVNVFDLSLLLSHWTG